MLGSFRLVILALSVCWAGCASAVELMPYVQSPLEGHPRTNAGLAFRNGALSMRADVAVKAESAATRAVPRVSSRLAVSDRIALVTHLRLPDWNGGVPASGTAIDSSVYFASQTAFIDRIEGRFRLDPAGVERRSLKLGFSDSPTPGQLSRSISITGNAMIEETLRPGSGDSLAIAAEAIVTGLPGTRFGLDFLAPEAVSSRVILRLRRSDGATDPGQENVVSLAYGHSWAIHDFSKLGVNLEASRAADGIEPVFGVSWTSKF